MWGMVQRRQHLRFAAEASQSVRIEGEGGGQNLDGHVAPQLGIASAGHLAPAAQPKEGLNVVRSDSCADRKRKMLPWRGVAPPIGHILPMPDANCKPFRQR